MEPVYGFEPLTLPRGYSLTLPLASVFGGLAVDPVVQDKRRGAPM